MKLFFISAVTVVNLVVSDDQNESENDCLLPPFSANYQCECEVVPVKVFSRTCPDCDPDCLDVYKEYDEVAPCDMHCENEATINNLTADMVQSSGSDWSCRIPLYSTFYCDCSDRSKVFQRQCPPCSNLTTCMDEYREYNNFEPCDIKCDAVSSSGVNSVDDYLDESAKCRIPKFNDFTCDCPNQAKVYRRDCPRCATPAECQNEYRDYQNYETDCQYLCRPDPVEQCQIPLFHSYTCDCQSGPAKVFTRNCPFCATDEECQEMYYEMNEIEACLPQCESEKETPVLDTCKIPSFSDFTCDCSGAQPIKVFTRNCPSCATEDQCQEVFYESVNIQPCDYQCGYTRPELPEIESSKSITEVISLFVLLTVSFI